MSATVIKVEMLSKQYRLGTIGTGTISHDLNRFWHRMRGNEDPYLKIGEENERNVKGVSEYVWALKDINFEVKQGEVLGIVGRNGAGKSTLLKILSRTTSPTIGCVKIKGRVASLLEVGTGFHPELTGRENIFLNGAILGMTKKEIKSKFDEIVDFAGVEKYIDTPVKRYSSGMYVRLAFGVAAHLEPEILIVDEVLAVGDAEFQKKALGKMKDVSKEHGRTVLFVSHNMAAIKQLCSQGILLVNGRLNYLGNINGTIDEYLKLYTKTGAGSKFISNSIVEKNFQLLEAEFLHNSINGQTEFNISEEINIRLKIRCAKKTPNIYGYIAIKNKQDELIIESDTFDYLPNILDNIEIGDHEYLIKINKNILSVGEYLFYINFSSTFANKFNVDSPGDILKFSVNDTVTKRGANRKAYTSHLIKWEVCNVNK